MRTAPTRASENAGTRASCVAQRLLALRRFAEVRRPVDPPRRRAVAELLLRRVELPLRALELDFRPRPELVLRPELAFFLRAGTFPPERRASDSPIAIACLRLVTFCPEPLFNVPRLRSRIA